MSTPFCRKAPLLESSAAIDDLPASFGFENQSFMPILSMISSSSSEISGSTSALSFDHSAA